MQLHPNKIQIVRVIREFTKARIHCETISSKYSAIRRKHGGLPSPSDWSITIFFAQCASSKYSPSEHNCLRWGVISIMRGSVRT